MFLLIKLLAKQGIQAVQIMNKPITIEYKYPWNMMPLEHSGGWIKMLNDSLKSSDPLFGKEIFVSGIHETRKFLLVENDTDGTFAIISISKSKKAFTCSTFEIISSREEMAAKLKSDHDEAISKL